MCLPNFLPGSNPPQSLFIESVFKTENYLCERVVVDGNLITSQSPGTAMEFALILVEILFGSNRLKKVNDGILARI